ncbi:Fic family protein [Brachybacterium sp. Marseille-Q7125]|uniref:Fic family protein n=1 Tax=Brachybacterium sp. Marseille-Q7125 TaxID=2932815 RepID=UPI001FF1BE29|nr:Fic family protein [Brachybacterium sp. Marseille-Q7125]
MVTVPVTVPVPPVGVRPGYWHVPDDGMVSRSARARGTGPYEATLPAPLAHADLTVPLDLSAAVSDAEKALVRYDSLADARLGAGNAAVGPMSSILLRTESASSSQIEDLTVGARQLALAELQESRSANATAVLANVRTMEAALRLADTLDLEAILAMHRELLQGTRGLAGREAGQLRSSLVWVGKDGSSPRHAVHIAPEAEDVPAAMTDLITFIGRQDLPILVHAAIAHAQFETIHPFADGNGRTGRALVHAMLHGKGLLTRQTAPVSSGLLHRHGDYIEALTAFRRGDAGPIIEQFVLAALFAAQTGSELIEELAAVLDRCREQLTGLRPHATAWRVLPLLVGNPVVNTPYLEAQLGVSAMTALRALGQLTDAGILQEATGRSRNRVWVQKDVLSILDAYAERARRRA